MTSFIDTAVIMYAAGAEHPLRDPSRQILSRIGDGTLDGSISVEVIQEIDPFREREKITLGDGVSLKQLEHEVSGVDLGPLAPCLPPRLYTAEQYFRSATEKINRTPEDEE